MSRSNLVYAGIMLAILASVGGYNFWLSHQKLNEQQAIAGIVGFIARNKARSRGNVIQYELIIEPKDRKETFRVPVRYEPAIPGIIANVRAGDSVTLFCAARSIPSLRTSIEIIHLVHKGNILLDFYAVQAASRRLALLCAVGVTLNIGLLFAANKRNRIRRFFKSRRFFA